MGIFAGSLDFWELGSVALGTVGLGKRKRKIGNSRIKRENSVEIAVAKTPPPHGSLRLVSQLILSTEWKPSADMSAVFQISSAHSGWEFGCCMDRVRPRESEMDFLRAGDIRKSGITRSSSQSSTPNEKYKPKPKA